MKQKNEPKDPFSIWPPPKKKKVENLDEEELVRNPSYHDRFKDMEAEINAPVFEGEEEEKVREEQEDEQDRDDEKDRK